MLEWPPAGIDWYFSDGSVCIAHADCRDILPLLPKVDLVLTDPPYGLGQDRAKVLSRGHKNIAVRDYGEFSWDVAISQDLLDIAIGRGTHAVVFGGNFYDMPRSSCWLVWDKDNSGDFADAELAWTNLKKAVRLFKWRWNGMLQENMKDKEYRYHPTQKPVALFKWCLQLVPDAQTILDPFAGSGTTGRAAKDLGRKAVLIEIEEKYCEIAAKRMSQSVMRL